MTWLLTSVKYFFLIFFISSFLVFFPVSSQTASPIPTPARPIDAGFTPLRFHCRQETSPEFHPLRPYPASPCDPLIPQKLPRADRDDSRLYLTPYCAKSLNVWGRVPAPQIVDATNNQVLPYPGNLAAQDGVLYFCEGSFSQICFIRNISFNVTWDFSDSEFPILGNTQDYLNDHQKVNDYLDWYLNGTVQQSEQIALDPDSDTDMNRLVTFGGPVKKLLPYDSQTNLKDILQTRNIGTDYRDYDVVNPVWPNTPFSSQEDITSEATVSVYESLEGQPTAPQIDGQIISIGLSIGSADSRLYFPHLRSSRALSDILSGMIRPSPNNISSTNNDVVTQVIRYHQGPNPPIPGGADSTTVQIAREYPLIEPGRVTRNTEVRENQPAPAPLLIYAELMGDSGQRCDLPAPSKPGDDLVGRQINGVLSYVQLFRYTPDIIIQDSCAAVGNPSNCRDNCAFEGDDCSSSEPCCYGSCPPEADFHCVYSDPNNIVIECPTYLTELLCVGNNNPCRWEAYATFCPPWPGNTLLNTGARAATFTKTPIVEKIYDTLIIGQQSVLRRFLPKPATSAGEYLEGETDLNNAKEIATSANYSGNAISNFVVDDRVDAGNGGSGALYFPRLQSLFRHFLGGNLDLNNNLQCLLRPFGQCQPPNLSCENVFDSFEENTGACGVCNADAELGPLARRILAMAGETFNVPAANIWTAMWHEGGDWPIYGGFQDEDVRKWSTPEWCGGEPMPECDNNDPLTQPPFGWLERWFYEGSDPNWTAVQLVDPSRNTRERVSRCNFMDAAFATAKALRQGSAMWADTSCSPPFTFDSSIPGTCAAWTNNKVAQSQRAYAGCALNPDGLTCSRCMYENPTWSLSDLVDIYNSKRCN